MLSGTAMALTPSPRSPHRDLTPLLMTSPFSSSAIINLPSPSNRYSSSPVVQTVLLATLQVNPLVAMGQEFHHPKIQYDISKEPHKAQVSTCRVSTAISREQRNSPVIEGALQPTNLTIEFDHPFLINNIRTNTYLTIGDLLEQLHAHFHKQAGSREMADIQQDMELYSTAIHSQKKRCRAAFDPDVEWNQGMKRIDILGKECKFQGVELDASSGSDNLTLRIAFGK